MRGDPRRAEIQEHRTRAELLERTIHIEALDARAVDLARLRNILLDAAAVAARAKCGEESISQTLSGIHEQERRDAEAKRDLAEKVREGQAYLDRRDEWRAAGSPQWSK